MEAARPAATKGSGRKVRVAGASCAGVVERAIVGFGHNECLWSVCQSNADRSVGMKPKDRNVKLALGSAVLVTLVLVSSSLRAQESGGGTVTPVDVIGATETGSYVGSGQYQPTIEEGILRGEAELARGQANYNYLSAEALKSLEQARSLNVDTRMKGLGNYWEAKRVNYELTLGQIKRFSTEQMAAIAKKEAPERLGPTQYEPFNGRLTWPSILSKPVFAAHRTALDEIFKKRTSKDVGAETEFHATVRELTDEMQVMLHRRIDFMPPMEYSAAKGFLTGLEQEARLAPGVDASVMK